jgi:hypothetical protein
MSWARSFIEKAEELAIERLFCMENNRRTNLIDTKTHKPIHGKALTRATLYRCEAKCRKLGKSLNMIGEERKIYDEIFKILIASAGFSFFFIQCDI